MGLANWKRGGQSEEEKEGAEGTIHMEYEEGEGEKFTYSYNASRRRERKVREASDECEWQVGQVLREVCSFFPNSSGARGEKRRDRINNLYLLQTLPSLSQLAEQLCWVNNCTNAPELILFRHPGAWRVYSHLLLPILLLH